MNFGCPPAAVQVAHGNEDTFREMLRIRRSVAASFSQTHFNTASVAVADAAVPATGAGPCTRHAPSHSFLQAWAGFCKPALRQRLSNAHPMSYTCILMVIICQPVSIDQFRSPLLTTDL